MSASKKRVRFAESPEVREYHQEIEPAGKRRALDPMEALEGEISGVCLSSNPGGDGMDAAQAAASRACRRRQLLMGLDLEGGDSLEAAEAEDPEEMFNDAGVPFEPFNLKLEREEGYFDEDGNYVEYKTDVVDDAWADELANVEVDKSWLERVIPGWRQAQALYGEPAELSQEAVADHKRRLLELLLPGENVLQALRRLAAVRQPIPGSGVSSGQASPSASSDPLARHPRALRPQAMPATVQQRFEALTGLSNTLMDAGVFTVHTMSREQLERSLAAGSGNSTAGVGGGSGAAAGLLLSAAGSARQGAGAGAGAGASDAGRQLAEQLLAAAGPAAGSGQNGASAGSGEEGSGGGRAGAACVAPQAAVDGDQDIFGDEDATTAAGSGAQPAPQAGQQQAAAVGSGRAQPEAVPLAAELEGAGAGDAAMQELPRQQQGQPPQEQQRREEGQQGPGGSGGPPQAAAAVAAATAIAGGQAPSELDGFVLDADSGFWYNSQLGCYWDAQRQLFGDAASGRWYSFDAGSQTYTLAS